METVRQAPRGVVLLAGATGFIGSALGLALVRQGYEVRLLSRNGSRAQPPFPAAMFNWQTTAEGFIAPEAAVRGVTAVVNLAGESIAEGRWTAARKKRLQRSRTDTTGAITRALAALPEAERPAVHIQASAVGYYGDRGDEQVDERSAPGSGFLASICEAWEGAAVPVNGVRQVRLRIGMVIGLEGGALPKLLSLYAKGAGANLGAGAQWVSFIHVDDLVRLIIAALEDKRWVGPVNATAPHPCRYRDLHRAILKARGGGIDFSVPRLFVRLGLGEQASMLLESVHAQPRAALGWGFRFQQETIDQALEHEMRRLTDRRASFLIARQFVGQPLRAVWPFFADERNLELLTPAWLQFKVTGKSTTALQSGSTIDYRLKLHGIPLRWRSRIDDWEPFKRFSDTQLKGPYALWHHTHDFEDLAGGTLMTDLVQFRLPVAPLGGLVAGAYVAHDVGKIFAFRRQTVDAFFGRKAGGP